MKKILPLLPILFCFFALTSCKEDNASPIRNVRFDPNLLNRAMDGTPCTSYSFGSGDNLRSLGTVYTERVMVIFSDALTDAERRTVLNQYGFVRNIESQTSSNSAMLHILTLERGLNCKQVEQALKELVADPEIAYSAPFFRMNTELYGLSNETIVTTTPDGLPDLEKYVADYKAELLMPLMDNIYLVRVDENSKGNSLDLANHLTAKQGIILAEPDLLLSLPAPDRPKLKLREVADNSMSGRF